MPAVNRAPPASSDAASALALAERLQRRFVEAIGPAEFTAYQWLRDEGRHGGGERFSCAETALFNRASVNVSCVHYEDEPQRKILSATALSTILHPKHPRAPSLHCHASFTQPREGKGTWRLMADLNPSHEDAAEKARFEERLKAAAPELFERARAEGDRYFFIPALGRRRGVSHFYVEDYASGDLAADRALAERFVNAVIEVWVGFFKTSRAEPTDAERAQQLRYHTLYLFQVLTLDRGTSSGLIAHDQNDLGVMGSIPAWVDRELLTSWMKPGDELLRAIIDSLPDSRPAHVTDDVRLSLAKVVRAHHRK